MIIDQSFKHYQYDSTIIAIIIVIIIIWNLILLMNLYSIYQLRFPLTEVELVITYLHILVLQDGNGDLGHLNE